MENAKQVAISKYSAMAKARQTVFIAVAVASMIVAVVGVSVYFIAQNILFNFKVIDEQNRSLSSLDASKNNIAVVEEAAKGLQAKMEADADIKSMVAGGEGSVLRLIVDALPTEPNSVSVGQSLEKDILSGLPVELGAINVDPVSRDVILDDSTSVVADDSEDSYAEDQVSNRVQSIDFSFSVSIKADDSGSLPLNHFTTILQRMEKSIRAFRVESYRVEYEVGGATMTIVGKAYYMPSTGLTLKNKTVTSSDKSSATQSAGVSQ